MAGTVEMYILSKLNNNSTFLFIHILNILNNNATLKLSLGEKNLDMDIRSN